MKRAVVCCDRPSPADVSRSTAKCRNCGLRQGINERPDLSKLGKLSPRELRAVEALALLGGKAGVGAISNRARMMPREVGILLQRAGCVLVEERAVHGRVVHQWALPAGVMLV